MHREDEYKHLANSTRKRGGEEQNALLRAQWEILAATYVRLADQSKKVDDTGTYCESPAGSHLKRRLACRDLRDLRAPKRMSKMSWWA